MSLVQFLRILFARWKLILATLVACVAVASTVAMLLPKRYPATARVMLDIGRPDPVTGQAVSARDRSYVRTQVELIKDMRVAGAAVDRLGLVNDPATIAAYRATGRTEADGGIRAWLGRQIIENTSAGLVAGSSILEIRYEANDPDRAKAIVGVLRDAYIDTALRFRTDAADRSSDWFRQQAERARDALVAAERDLAAFMEENKVIVVGGVDGDTARLQQLQAALQQARGSQTSAETAAAASVGVSPAVSQLEISLAAIDDEIALASTRLGPEHPAYKALQARRATVQRALNQARSSSGAQISAFAGAARKSVADLEREVAAQQQVVLDRKPVIDELVRLSREVELRRQQYDGARARTAQLRLEADVSETGLVVLGDPVASRTPSYPKVNQIIAMSVAFGLGLGILAAIVAEFIARRVRGQEDLAYAAGVPVLVTVGAAAPSPLRLRIQKLLGRRPPDEPDTRELQAI